MTDKKQRLGDEGSNKLALNANIVSASVLGTSLVWWLGLSGPLRLLIGRDTQILAGSITVAAVTFGAAVVLAGMKITGAKRIISLFLTGNFFWIVLVSIRNGAEPWVVLAGSSILLFFPVMLCMPLFIKSGAGQLWVLRFVWFLLGANLMVLFVQLAFLQGVDRATGLLGNDRASNTIAVFTLLSSLALWVRSSARSLFFSLAQLAPLILSAIFAWLGDAKAALGIVLAMTVFWMIVQFVVSRLKKNLAEAWGGKLLISTVVIGGATLLAFQGLATGSSANLGPNVREQTVQLYTANLEQHPPALEVLAGTGLGSGASLLTHLINQGTFGSLGLEATSDKHSHAESRRNFSDTNSGLFYSPQRTALGVIDELGIVGAILYLGLILSVLASYRKCVSIGNLMGVLCMTAIALVLTPFGEYPEFAISLSVFFFLMTYQRPFSLSQID